MYFLKTGSPAHLRWLRFLEPLMVITGIVQPLATIPSISKLYFTHSQHASGQTFPLSIHLSMLITLQRDLRAFPSSPLSLESRR
jgi:hypothetical protein